jgi:Dolichyl-phosphate-mannose-protein mannosyltransferase
MASVKFARVLPLRRPSFRDWYLPLVLLVVAAVIVRILLMTGYPSAVYAANDELRFARVPGYPHDTGLFGDTWVPAGYPAFLLVARAITSWLPFTIALQHVVGLLTGLRVYATLRRASAPRWLALLPAAVVLLDSDQLWTEHVVLSEVLFTFFVTAGLYAAVRAWQSGSSTRWLVASGLLMALSGLTRNVGLALPLVVAIWALFVTRGRWTARLRSGALVVLPAAALIAMYVVTANVANGAPGLTEMAGWNLYGRVGQFANCKKFTPPAGTARFCDSTPPAIRSGPFFYVWNPGSPARAATGQRVEADNAGAPGRFARAAIIGQPLDYARVVVKDMVRFVDPTVGTDRPESGDESLSFDFAPNPYSDNIEAALRQKYSGVGQNTSLRSLFESYDRVFTPGSLGIALLALLSVAGVVFGRGRARSPAVLLTASALVLYLGSVATWSYDSRYGVPPLGALAGCAALGGLALASRAAQTSTESERGTPWPATAR